MATPQSNSTNKDTLKVGGIFPVLYPETKEKYKIVVKNGVTIGDTREKRNYSSASIFSPGMLQVAIFGEALARKGLYSVVDNLTRTPEIKGTIYLAAMEDGTDNLSKLKLETYPNPGVYLRGLLKNNESKGFLLSTTLYQFRVNYITPGKNPVIPLLKITEDKRIEISGTGIFKKDKLISKIGTDETRSLVMLRGIKGTGFLPFTIEKNGKQTDIGSVQVNRYRKVKVIRDGDNFLFYVTIQLKGRLVELYSQQQFIASKPSITAQDVEKAIKKHVSEECTSFVQKMQEEFRVDCIDISKYALAKWRNELQDKVDKEDFIENATIIVDVDVHIEEFGENT